MTQIYHQTFGKGKPIVLVHGLLFGILIAGIFHFKPKVKNYLQAYGNTIFPTLFIHSGCGNKTTLWNSRTNIIAKDLKKSSPNKLFFKIKLSNSFILSIIEQL